MRWRRADPEDAFLQATQPAVDLVYNLARRLTPRPPDAEDLVQETYLHAWRGWRAGTRPRRVEPWLATICLNLGRDRARWSTRHPESLADDPDRHLLATVDVAHTAVDRIEVNAALAQLSESKRVAVILSDVCGLTAREVATVTGCPLGTALARIHRGRRELAERLGAGEPTTAQRDRGGESGAS